MAVQYYPVSWAEYHALARKLAAAILTSRTRPNQIVAISRGGLTLGHILSDLLRLPISVFAIQSYLDISVQGKLTITEPLARPVRGKDILLVDDVSDTGKTFVRAIEYLRGLSPATVTTLAMFLKPQSCYVPDYFARKTDRWIIYPYEMAETISSISSELSKSGKTKAEIQSVLIKLGYDTKQIAFVRKHHLSR